MKPTDMREWAKEELIDAVKKRRDKILFNHATTFDEGEEIKKQVDRVIKFLSV